MQATATSTAALRKRRATPTETPSAKTRRPRLAIVVGMGWGVRNYLLGDTYRLLKERYDIIILSPYAELPDFVERFAPDNTAVYGRFDLKPKKSMRFYENLAVAAFYHRRPTNARDNKLREMRNKLTKYKSRGFTVRLTQQAIDWCWRRPAHLVAPYCCPLVIRLYRHMLAKHWDLIPEMRQVIARERVDAVFSTNFVEPWEWAVSMAAAEVDLPVVTAITSWDNPTTKKFPICDYAGYLAWSPQMRQELVDHIGVADESRIRVIGAPQFDFYFNPAYHQSREEFCRQYGLDPQRKIVVYSTVTPGLMPDNPDVVRHVHDYWKNQLPGNPQLLVRLHPKDRMERYEALRDDPDRSDIVWTLAGNPRIAAKDQWCPDHDDMVRAVNTVRHGDVNIHAGYSTMMLDFAALDKPVIIVGYNSQGCTKQSRTWESYEHLQPVLRSGAVRVAYAPDETEQLLRRALEQPELDSAARRELIEFELGTIDGGAGRRAAEAVIEMVDAALANRQSAH